MVVPQIWRLPQSHDKSGYIDWCRQTIEVCKQRLTSTVAAESWLINKNTDKTHQHITSADCYTCVQLCSIIYCCWVIFHFLSKLLTTHAKICHFTSEFLSRTKTHREAHSATTHTLTTSHYNEPKQPVNDVDVDAAVASTEVGRVYSFADSDMKSANGINHTQIVKKAST